MRIIRKYVMVAVTVAFCGGLLALDGLAQSVAAPAVSVIPAAANVTVEQSFAVTVEVATVTGAPAPTGTVVLSAGDFEATADLRTGGEAAITVPGGVLTAGTDVLTAEYTPDAASAPYYYGASGEAKVVVYPEPSYFSIAAPGIKVARGETSGNTIPVRVEPYRGFAGVVTLTAAITGAPKQVHDLPRLSFGATNQVRISGNEAGTAMLTVTTTGAGSGAGGVAGGISIAPAGGAMLAGLLLLAWPMRRKKWMRPGVMRVVQVMGVALLSLGLMGCGVQGASAGPGMTSGTRLGTRRGTTPGDYIVTVTGAATGVSATGQFVVTVR